MAGGPLKPGFGLSGAVRWLQKLFLPLVRAFASSIPTRLRVVRHSRLRGGEVTPDSPPHGHTKRAHASLREAGQFGDNSPFTLTSEVRPGTRAFPSFSAAVAEIANARVFGGIHFRTSCVRGNALGQAVAAFVSSHAMRSLDE